jgi:hypothetical protein
MSQGEVQMSYELTLEIAEESPEGRNIAAIAEDERVTREEAALRILQRPGRSRNGSMPRKGSRIIGSFSTPEESALIDDAMALVFEERERRNSLAGR